MLISAAIIAIIITEGVTNVANFTFYNSDCGNVDTRVIDSRPAEDHSTIRRRRCCDECGKRFTTYEKVETIPLIVIKKDDNREQYDRSKIEGGVLRACYKRPVSAEQIHNCIPVSKSELVPGDLLLFKKKGASRIHHVGIYAGNGMMIHSPQTGDVIRYTSVVSGYYNDCYYAARRIVH